MAAKKKVCPVCGREWKGEDRGDCDGLGHTGVAARGRKVVHGASLPAGWS